MVGTHDRELTPLTRAQLDFASAMVDSYARGTKFWFQFWGPLGNPAMKLWMQRPKHSRITCEG